jgi:hypothetical protein
MLSTPIAAGEKTIRTIVKRGGINFFIFFSYVYSLKHFCVLWFPLVPAAQTQRGGCDY